MLAESDVLSVRHASVSLSGRTIVQDVTFTLKAGEFCGLIGSNGSGKTTLLRGILGLVKLSGGSVTTGAGGGRLASIGYVPQKVFLDPFLPIRARDLISLGLDGHRLGIPLPSKARDKKVDDMLEAVGAAEFADQRIGSLSGGQQQRVLIGHALIRRPRLLLLDEPLSNLDMASVAGIVALLRRFSRDQGLTVLVSSHDMNPLLSAMDRIIYLAHGRAASGPTNAVVSTKVLSELYGYHIDVIRVHGRVLVVAADPDAASSEAIARDPLHVAHIP